jgi:hypothetical protein
MRQRRGLFQTAFARLARGARQHLLDRLSLQQIIGTTSGNHAKTRGQHIEERSGIPIETIETRTSPKRGEAQAGRHSS